MDDQRLERQVQELRAASRKLVRALGLMDHQAHESCSPAQCHALIEVGARGRLTAGELSEILEVDKSTASRTVRPLLSAGLLVAEPDPIDQRTKPLRLSETGRERLASIHQAADAQVRSALERLSDPQRETVLQGIRLYQQALHRSKALATLRIRPIEVRDEPAMADVIRVVMNEYGAVGCGYSSEDAEVDAMWEAYRADRHAYFVAEIDGEVVAGGGIAPLRSADSDDVCELRKMHALPRARGLGVGRQLLELCLSEARRLGFRQCYLETLQVMHRARALYEKFGFRKLDRPCGDTGHFACDDYYLLDLGDPNRPGESPSSC